MLLLCVCSRLAELLGLPEEPNTGGPSLSRLVLDDAAQHLRFASSLSPTAPQLRFVYQLVVDLRQQLSPPLSSPVPFLVDRLRLLLTSNCADLLPGTERIDTSHLLPSLNLPPLPLPSLPAPSLPLPSPTASRPSTAAKKAATSAAAPAPRPTASPRPTSAAKPKAGKGAAAEVVPVPAAPEAAVVDSAPSAPLPPPPPPPHCLAGWQAERLYGHLQAAVLQHAELYTTAYAAGREGDEEVQWWLLLERPHADWAGPLDSAVEEAVRSDAAAAGEAAQEAVDCALALPAVELTEAELAEVTALKAELEGRLRERAAEVKGKSALLMAPVSAAAVAVV